MKKIIFGIILTILVLSLTVNAFYPTVTEEGNEFKIVMPVEKGWNLIPSIENSYWDLKESEIVGLEEEDVKLIFIHLPLNNKYVRTHPGTDTSDIPLINQNNEYIKISAAWYYIELYLNLHVAKKEILYLQLIRKFLMLN